MPEQKIVGSLPVEALDGGVEAAMNEDAILTLIEQSTLREKAKMIFGEEVEEVAWAEFIGVEGRLKGPDVGLFGLTSAEVEEGVVVAEEPVEQPLLVVPSEEDAFREPFLDLNKPGEDPVAVGSTVDVIPEEDQLIVGCDVEFVEQGVESVEVAVNVTDSYEAAAWGSHGGDPCANLSVVMYFGAAWVSC